MTQPASYDFAIRRGSAGDYAAISLAVLQIDGVTPVPLAGATATMTIALACGTTLVLSSAPGGELTLDIIASTITWLPTRKQTLAISPGQIDTYDLTIAFANGSVGPYLTGFLIGLDDGDPVPEWCQPCGTGLSSLVRVIKVLVPGPPGPPGEVDADTIAALQAQIDALKAAIRALTQP